MNTVITVILEAHYSNFGGSVQRQENGGGKKKKTERGDNARYIMLILGTDWSL